MFTLEEARKWRSSDVGNYGKSDVSKKNIILCHNKEYQLVVLAAANLDLDCGAALEKLLGIWIEFSPYPTSKRYMPERWTRLFEALNGPHAETILKAHLARQQEEKHMDENVYYYTEAEEGIIREMWTAFAHLKVIARAVERSPRALQAKVHRMKLPKRDTHVVQLVHKHGKDVLRYGKTAKKILAGLERERCKALLRKRRIQRYMAAVAIKRLKRDLAAGVERNKAMQCAVDAGAKLDDIGKVVGMTKQGVSWILKEARRHTSN